VRDAEYRPFLRRPVFFRGVYVIIVVAAALLSMRTIGDEATDPAPPEK